MAPNGAIYAMPWEASAVLRVATDVRLLGHLGVTNQGKFGFTVASQDGQRGVMKDAEFQNGGFNS